MKHIKNLCQATLKVLLAIAMVFSTGISGVFADEVSDAIQQQEIVANDLVSNKVSIKKALDIVTKVSSIKNGDLDSVISFLESSDISNLLTATNNLNDDYPTTALAFITAVGCTSGDALCGLQDAIRTDVTNGTLKPTITDYINGKEELEKLKVLIDAVRNNNSNFKVSTLIQAIKEYKKPGDTTNLSKLNTLISAAETYTNDSNLTTLIGAIEQYYGDTNKDALDALSKLILDVSDLKTKYSNINGDKTAYTNNFVEKLKSSYENDYPGTKEYIKNLKSLIPDFNYIGIDDVESVIDGMASDTTVNKISINGLEMNVDNSTDTIYVGYLVEDLEVIVNTAQQAPYVTVEINKPEQLVVGENTVTIKITSLSGQVKVYTFTVIRATADDEQGDGTDEVVPTTTQAPAVEPMVYVPETEEETTTSYVASSNKETEEVKDETEKKETKKDDKEYDEEVEEEKGLNGFTILLIVAGIALIGFGIYMLFGDKDDEKPINYNQKQKQPKQQNNKKRK